MNFNLLSNTPSGDEENHTIENDKIYSGKYLISGIRHKVMAQHYVTVLEVIKDSTPEDLIPPDNGSQIWQNTVQGVKDA